MPREYYNTEISDYEVSEADKSKKKYLVAATDDIIQTLVNRNEDSMKRRKMQRMRDFYEGYRNQEEFQFLEDNYGVGTPTELKFIPIVRNRIDVLIGILSTTTFDFQINVIDNETIDLMLQERSMAVLQDIYDTIQKNVEDWRAKYQGMHSNEMKQQKLPRVLDEMVEQSKKKIGKKWRSIFVKAANNLIKYYLYDIDTDMHQKRRTIFEDLLVTGECAYRVRAHEYGRVPELEVLLPENFYHDLPRDKKLIKKAHRAVYVRYMTKKEVLKEYGHLMEKEDKELLFSMQTVKYSSVIRSPSELERRARVDQFSRRINDETRYLDDANVVKVYECEWIALNKQKENKTVKKASLPVDGPDKIHGETWRKDRYQSIRIEDRIYLEMGKSEFVRRTKKDPKNCELTFNGIRYSDRNGEPYSLVWKCKDLQDMHDIIYFHRDALVANSGVRGSRVNIGALPDFLGTTMMERVLRFLGYRKQGIEMYDGTKDAAQGVGAQLLGDFDGGLDGNAIQGLNAILVQLDDEVTKITGVTPQMLGQIEQREAVSNVKQGMIQSNLTTKNLFEHNDLIMKHILNDMLTMTQKVYEDSPVAFSGSYPERGMQHIFKVIPKHFTMTDYNIHVTSTSDEFTKVSMIRASLSDLINANAVKPHALIKVMTTDSLQEMYEILEDEFEAAEAENRKIAEAEQAIEQLQKENKDLQSKAKKHEEIQAALDKAKLQLDQWKAQKDYEIDDRKVENDKEHKSADIELKKQTVELERLQLEQGTGREKEVKNL